MQYISTRDKSVKYTGTSAIVKGISKEGGLFVPLEIPLFDSKKIKSFIDKSYSEVAFEVLNVFLDEIDKQALKREINEAYDTFDSDDICPLNSIRDDLSVLELFHGKTLAFKDVALSLLPRLLKESKKINNVKTTSAVLVATSGDTGSSALCGFAGVKDTVAIAFYPLKGVSEIQKLQMETIESENVFVSAIDGNFDDAQALVKKIFCDEKINNLFNDNNLELTSANSINLGRLLPQIVYYFTSYVNLVKLDKIKFNQKINFVVPTGNFGDILAGFYAYKMGLPVNKLICASNENNVLADFFNTGEYNAKRDFKITTSPSMDILVSSNLERLLFEYSGRDSKYIQKIMGDLKNNYKYSIDRNMLNELNKLFFADYADEKETNQAIKKQFSENNYLIDPHTAVAFSVYDKYKGKTNDDTYTVILSTADPYKFTSAIAEALDIKQSSNTFENILKIEKNTKRKVSKKILDLEDKEIRKTYLFKKDTDSYQFMHNFIKDIKKVKK